MSEHIKLNDLLNLTEEQLGRTKIRFMVPSEGINFDPNTDSKDPEKQDTINMVDLVYNREKSISFEEGVIAIGFIRIGNDRWLMTGIVEILRDNGKGKAATAKYLTKKFNYRVVIDFHKYFENGIIRALMTSEKRFEEKLIDNLFVSEILAENGYLSKGFPGYKNVRESFDELKWKLGNSSEWQTALKAQKGVYLITDKETGKLYVGSAYGKDGILGRWRTYMESGYDAKGEENGEYPNKGLQELVKEKGVSYLKKNFQYSILETFSNDATDDEIINREQFWKEVLDSRNHGYNCN